MLPSKKSQEIASAFTHYVETGDKSKIQAYKREEIEIALLQYSRDKGWPHYEAMERRINELKGIEDVNRNIKEKWKDRIIGFFFGIGIAVIARLLLHWLTKK